MGCTFSRRKPPEEKYAVRTEEPCVEADVKAPAATAATEEKNDSTQAATQPAPAKKKLDPKDFMFMGLKGESRVKLPGSINGQQFVIDSCEDCDLYILDHCDMVTIDDCKNCRIFVGPTDSSVFIRTSSNCKCAFITRQLRTRDCTSCDILLHCRTRPIIESSTAMGFACHNSPYQGLGQQLAACKLSPLHNFWSHVYDFTPSTDHSSSNWHLLPSSTTRASLMGAAVPEEARELLGCPEATTTAAEAAAGAAGDGGSEAAAGVANGGSVCLLQTLGALPPPSGYSSLLFLLFPSRVPWVDVLGLLQKANCQLGPPDITPTAEQQQEQQQAAAAGSSSSSRSSTLLCTNEAPVPATLLQQMAAAAGWSKSQTRAFAEKDAKSPCIGLELAVREDYALELSDRATMLGGVSTANQEVAGMFKCLGVEG